MAADMTRPQIIRAATFPPPLAYRITQAILNDPERVADRKRAKARQAWMAAGMVETCGGIEA